MYPTKTHTDLDAEHISNNPQGFMGIFVLFVNMEPRNCIGRNIQFTNKYNIKTGKWHEQIKNATMSGYHFLTIYE